MADAWPPVTVPDPIPVDRVLSAEEWLALDEDEPGEWVDGLVDPALSAFEIFELTAEGNYQKLVGVTEGVIEAVPGCEGLRISMDALWEELSRLSD